MFEIETFTIIAKFTVTVAVITSVATIKFLRVIAAAYQALMY